MGFARGAPLLFVKTSHKRNNWRLRAILDYLLPTSIQSTGALAYEDYRLKEWIKVYSGLSPAGEQLFKYCPVPIPALGSELALKMFHEVILHAVVVE